jgi:hypothetical protein
MIAFDRLMPRQQVRDIHRTALAVIIVIGFESELAALPGNFAIEKSRPDA